jgi:large subunit ribosomal protein L10
MTKEEKGVIIDELKEKFAKYPFFYIADASSMTVNDTNRFRRMCFERGIEYKVVKNSLIRKALETTGTDYTPFHQGVLKGFSGIMFTTESGAAPAKLLQDFRKDNTNQKPLLKGASIDSSLFMGDESLDVLSKVKSRLEMIAELLGTIQAPGQRLASALQSGGSKLAGALKALEEKKS